MLSLFSLFQEVMSEVTSGKKRYPSDPSDLEKAQIFIQSDFWQKCLQTKFADWGGSQDAWNEAVFKAGTNANIAYHNVIDAELERNASENTEKTSEKTSETSSEQSSEKKTDDSKRQMSVFTALRLEKELKQSTQTENSAKKADSSEKKTPAQDDFGKVGFSPNQNPTGGKTADKTVTKTATKTSQDTQSEKKAKTQSKSKSAGLKVDLNTTLASTEPLKFHWDDEQGIVTNKNHKLNFGSETPGENNTKSWQSAFNEATGQKVYKPLSQKEIADKRLTGISARDIDYTNKFSFDSGEDFCAPRENRQPLWTDRPSNIRYPTHYRLPLERIWGQNDIDFSKIPSMPSNYRPSALVRLKKHDYLPANKSKPAELLLLRMLTSRNQVALESLEKIFQQIAIITRSKEVIRAIKVARRILADTIEPHYCLLSKVDKLGHADPVVATKKQKDLIDLILKKQWEHPSFKTASTDTSVRLPPKESLAGKPASIIDYEKKSRNLSDKKFSFNPLKQPTSNSRGRGNGPRGRGRGSGSNSRGRGRGRGRGTKRKNKFSQPHSKKKAVWCNKCRRSHGKKENFTCPNQ